MTAALEARDAALATVAANASSSWWAAARAAALKIAGERAEFVSAIRAGYGRPRALRERLGFPTEAAFERAIRKLRLAKRIAWEPEVCAYRVLDDAT